LKERIRGIGLARARVLWNAGYKTPEAVAAVTANQLQQLLSIGESEASSILNSARAAT
jgi:hypothetical protein